VLGFVMALASAVAKIDRDVLAALASFEGLPHRMQRIAEVGLDAKGGFGPLRVLETQRHLVRSRAGNDDVLEKAFSDCWRFPFSDVAHKYGFTRKMTEAGVTSFAQIEVTEPMHGYGDLHILRELRQKLFLVTSGFRRLQESKVNALEFGNSLPKSESTPSMSLDQKEKHNISRRFSNRIP